MRPVLVFVAACVLLGAQAPACAEEQNAIEKAARQMGSDAEKMGKQAGEAAKKVGRDIGAATTRTARSIKKEFKEDVIDGKNDDPSPKKQKVDRPGRR